MDENRLRWIAVTVVIAIGAAYMGWLVLSYLQSVRTQEYIKTSVDGFLFDLKDKVSQAPQTVPAEVVHNEPDTE